MRKYLVIGCGGSGGATLRYLMDQLRADLSGHGVDSLPAAWQFLHFDVPVSPDSGPGLLGSVPDQGGTYRSLSFTGAKYSNVAAQVDNQFLVNGAANGLASWRPDPELVTFPITEGAGQYRAVGRVLTLARARTEILPALQEAWNRLQAPEVNSEMQSLVHEHKISGLGSVNPADETLILIVSSMAGGSGASMVLDVARLLTMVEGVNPGLIGMFLYLPDAFQGLDKGAIPGVEANGAAALAELIAAQARAEEPLPEPLGPPGARSAREASDAFRAMGLVGLGGRQSFARVFPIGRSIGATGAILGDGQPTTIFRALGRGLAALMMAGQASDQLAEYDFTNPQLDARTEQFGWGVNPASLAWGSFGYASLSLGRDRYAEYAAQRLSRVSLDRLVFAHQQPGDNRPGVEQVRSLVGQRLPAAELRIGLPGTGQPIRRWFSDVALPSVAAGTGAPREISAQEIEPWIRPEQAGKNPEQWLVAVRAQVAQQAPRVQAAIDLASRRWASQWHKGLIERIEGEAANSIATLGLPYTIKLLEELRRSSDAAAELLRRAAEAQPNPVALPPDVQSKIDSWQRTRGVLVNPEELGKFLVDGYRTSIEGALRLRAADLGARILGSLGADLLEPLEDACRSALDEVERARELKPVDVGLAQVRTNHYASWPTDGHEAVPARFAHAENEVLLTTSDDFPGLFDLHLSAEYPALSPLEMRERCAESVIEGKWETVAGLRAPGGLIERRAMWRPAQLATDPDTGKPILAGRAAYTIHVKPSDILTRARLFVERPAQPFQRYTSESLHDFIANAALTESEQANRERLVVDRFRQTLNLARPVVGVSPEAVESLHGKQVSRRYKFGPVPFAQTGVAERLGDVLSDSGEGIEATTRGRYTDALVEQSPITRIDVFGSYELYLPLVFTSLLKPISSRWASTRDFGRKEFWQWRRARPLPDALPLGRDQRRAMVAGWLLGEITGMIKVTGDFGGPGADPAYVWDQERGTWLAFLPNPGLIGRDEFHVASDFLTAILETMVLAIAESHDSRSQEPLRPYTALRQLYDKAERPTRGGLDLPVAAVHMARWIASGATRSGRSIVGGQPATAQGRQEGAIRWLDGLAAAITTKEEAAARALIPNRSRVLDLAEDFRWSCTQLRGFAVNPPEVPDIPDPVDPGRTTGGYI